MAVTLPHGKQKFNTATGAPGVGYRLHTYIPGTTTPKATFRTYAGTTANTNPIIADSRGEMAVYWSGDYDVVLRDASGVLIWGPERLTDDPNGLRSDLASNELGKGAELVYFNPSTTYASSTIGKDLATRVRTLESFGVTGVGDDGTLIQVALNWCIDNNSDVVGYGKYITSSTLTIRQDHVVGVNQDFASFKFTINQLTYTGSGKAISVASPCASVYVKKLIGAGVGVSTDGLYITGQGDGARHRVDWAKGFDRCINLDAAYSHTVEVGYLHDALRGVLINGNANRIFGGRIGGQFSASATDSTTCNVGVEISAGSAANEIYANIEYARRTTSSVGLLDQGVCTYYRGYIESCNEYNIKALGNDGVYEVLNGGNNNASPSGYQIFGRNNRVLFLSQGGSIEETPSGSVNTLEFLTTQPLEFSSTSRLASSDGFDVFFQGTSQYKNEIVYSSELNNAAWGDSVLGSASWASVTDTTGSNGYTWGGMTQSTRFVFPALPNSNDIYRINQSSLTTTAGIVNFGVFAKVISGDVDVMVRLLETTNNKQTRTMMRLKPSSGFVRIGREFLKTSANATDATFELSFRSVSGGTIDLFGAYLVNSPGVLTPPINLANVKRPLIGGCQIHGNMVATGLIVNGPLQTQASPLIAGAATISTIEYPVYLVTGGWTGNITLTAPTEENSRVVFKRDGVAATGALNIVLSGTTIDGSSGSVSIQTTYSKIELFFSTAGGGWLNIT
jgi:hypothetical protein